MKKNKAIHSAIFFTVVFIVFWLFGYFDVFNFGPRTTHYWRQSDSFAMAMGYYHNGMDFFKPMTYNLTYSKEGYAASEFPIMYYLSAWCYRWFGPHVGILRLLNVSVYLLGLYAISRLFFRVFKGDYVLSLAPSVILMSSPILAFYSFNYIPDPVALGISFIGVYCYGRYVSSQRNSWLYGMAILMTLAGLIKITCLIPFFAWVATVFLAKIFSKGFQPKTNRFLPSWTMFTLITVIPITIVGGWYAWVKQYNAIHESYLFLIGMKPIWKLSVDDMLNIAEQLGYFHLHRILNPVIVGLLILASIVFLFTKKLPRLLLLYFGMTVLILAVYALLFFEQFKHHDYYLIAGMSLPMIVLFIAALRGFASSDRMKKVWKAGFVVAAILSIFTGSRYMDKVYDIDYSDNNMNRSYYDRQELRTMLSAHGIEYGKAEVLSVPSINPNYSLCAMDVMGYTVTDPYYITTGTVKYFAEKGADYLVVEDKALLSSEKLHEALKMPIDSFKNEIFIFDIAYLLQDQ